MDTIADVERIFDGRPVPHSRVNYEPTHHSCRPTGRLSSECEPTERGPEASAERGNDVADAEAARGRLLPGDDAEFPAPNLRRPTRVFQV